MVTFLFCNAFRKNLASCRLDLTYSISFFDVIFLANACLKVNGCFYLEINPKYIKDLVAFIKTGTFKDIEVRNDINLNCDMAVDNLFIGCSFTAGDGVSNSERFTDNLNTSSYNAGISGSGFVQQCLIAEYCANFIQPKRLIISPYIGCIQRNFLKEGIVDASNNDLIFYTLPSLLTLIIT